MKVSELHAKLSKMIENNPEDGELEIIIFDEMFDAAMEIENEPEVSVILGSTPDSTYDFSILHDLKDFEGIELSKLNFAKSNEQFRERRAFVFLLTNS